MTSRKVYYRYTAEPIGQKLKNGNMLWVSHFPVFNRHLCFLRVSLAGKDQEQAANCPMLRPTPSRDPPAAYNLKAEAPITSGAAAPPVTATLWQGGLGKQCRFSLG